MKALARPLLKDDADYQERRVREPHAARKSATLRAVSWSGACTQLNRLHAIMRSGYHRCMWPLLFFDYAR
ncbi:hypothetical protein [Paraburkholderia azotifigens]|uniref:hypothetical protein n=1 Tax=Paraburkholderia azotifigens TaxID=2057004 RepID=UPI00319E58F6